MADNELQIEVGVLLNTKNIASQLKAITDDKDNIIKVTVQAENALKDLKKLDSNIEAINNSQILNINVNTQSLDSAIDSVERMRGILQEASERARELFEYNEANMRLNNNGGGNNGRNNNARTVYAREPQEVDIDRYSDQLDRAIERYQNAFNSISDVSDRLRVSGLEVIHNEINDSYSAVVRFTNAIGQATNVTFQLRDSINETGEGTKEWVTSGQRFSESFKDTTVEIDKLQSQLNDIIAKSFNRNNVLVDNFATPINDGIGQIQDRLNELRDNSDNNGIQITIEQIRQLSQELKDLDRARIDAQSIQSGISGLQSQLDNIISKSFNGNNPLIGEFSNSVTEGIERIQNRLNELRDNAQNSGIDIITEQIRDLQQELNNLDRNRSNQQNLQSSRASDVRQYYSELNKEYRSNENQRASIQKMYEKMFDDIDAKQKTALNTISNAENKLNEIQNDAFSGTNALTGDFATEATNQIEAVRDKFAEIRKAAEESFSGASNVSKDELNKMLNDLESDLNRLAKLEYPSDKLAAQNVDVKKAFAADALVEMENRLKSLGNSTTEYYNRVQDLKTLLSQVGQVDSDPSAWANFRNELHMLEDDIKKFESSAQGMGQKLASGIETGQLQQVVDMVDRLNNIDEKFSGTGVEALQQNLQSLASEYMNLMEQLQNPNLTQDQFSAIAKQVQELDTQLKQLTKEAATFGDQNSLDRFASSTASLKLNLEKLENQYSTLIAKNPELAARIEDLKQRLESLRPGQIPAITKDISNLGKEMANASGQSAGLRGALQDAFGGFGTYLARFTSSYYIITKTIQGIKSMVNSVKEVDTSLVELQKVTNLTGTSLSQFTEQAYQAGANLGRTGQDVIDATTTFSRAGYDLQEAAQLAQSALVMTNVGVDIPNIDSAASDMISILKAFDVQAEESMGVIDKLYNVANKEPLDFGNITQMLVTAGGTLAQTGTTLEQTMGMLTGAFATLRDESVANGLVMISQRIRGLSEDGEEVDGLAAKLKDLYASVGVNVEDQNGQLRSTFSILDDLNKKWDQMSSKQKQYFGEKSAGNRQVKVLNALMQNWDVVTETIENANNAEGEALKGNEMYMDSIKGRITQLKSAMQELAMATINSDFVKGIVSMGTNVVKLVSDIGGLVPVLTTILGVVLAIKGADIFNGIRKIGGAIKTLFTAGSLTSLAGLPGILLAVASAIAMVVAYINNANSAINKFEQAKESYEEHKNKVESLNDELKTTQDRITELEGKEIRTIVEEKELKRLKDVNEQLQTQIELEQKLMEIAQGQAKDAATKVIEEENAKKPIVAMTADQIRKEISQNLSDDIIKGIVADQWKTMPLFSDEMSYAPTAEEEVRLRMEAIKQDYAELVKVQEQIANLKPGHAAVKDELDAESDALTENIENNKRALSDYYNWLEKQTEGWEHVEGAKPGSKEAYQNELLDFKKAIGDAILFEDAFNPPINDQVVNDILAKYSDAVEEIKSKLKETGDFTVDDLGAPQFEAMIQELEKYGFTVDEIVQMIKQKLGSIGDGIELPPQMSINVEDVKNQIYQNTEGYSAITKAISEQEKSGVISAETLDKVLNESKLNGVASALERTANGYRLNTDRINELIVAQNKEGQIDAIAGIMERQLAIDELVDKYGSLEAAMQDADAANQINQYQSEIAVLQALADEAENAASALDKLRAAQKSPNQGADYSDAQSALEKTKKAYEEGKVGTDDFKAGMDYLLGDNWQSEFEGNLDKAFKAFEEKRKQYFSGDDFQDATNFAEDLVDKGMLGYDEETGKLTVLQNEATGATYTLEEMADALGISKDAAQDLFELLNEYSLDDQFTFDTPIDSAEKLAAAQKKLTELEEKRAQLEKEIAEAQEPGGDTTGLEDKKAELEEVTEQATSLASAIETAQEAMDNGEFKPPQTLEEALAKLKEYEDAITNLNAMGITTPVELQGDFDKLLNFVSGGDGNGNYNIAVTDTGNAQAQLQKINEEIAKVEKARDEGNLSVEIAAEITGSLDKKKDALDAYIAQAEQLQEAVPGGSLAATITFNAETGEWEVAFDEVEADKEKLEGSPVQIGFEESSDKSGSAVAEQVQEEVDGIEAPVDAVEGDKTGSDVKSDIEDDVEGIEAPVDAVEGDSTGSDIKSTYEGQVDGIEATVEAKADKDSIESANSDLDAIPKEKEVVIKVKGPTIEEVEEAYSHPWGESFDQPFEIPIGTSVDEDEVADQVQDAVEEGANNAEPTVTPEPETDKITDGIEEAAENADAKTEVEADVNINADADDVEDEIEDGMPESEEFKAEANTDGVEEKVRDSVPKEVEFTPTPTPSPTPTPTPTPAPEIKGSMSMDTSSADSSISTTQSKASETQTMDLDADTSSADSKIDKTHEDASKPETMSVTADVHRSELDGVIGDINKDYTMTVKVKYEETGPKPQAAATGTSNAKGGLSLVDEEGAELIEHKKSGTFELGTNNGARFTHLDKGDVVHTADETKKILSRMGYLGGFFKDGLNKAKSIIGNAFAIGTTSRRKYRNVEGMDGTSVGGSGSKPQKRSTSSGSGGKKRHSSGHSSKDDKKEDKSKWSEWAKEFFDWAEIKLKNLKEATEELIRQSQRAIGVWAKNKKIKEALNSIEKEIKANEEAYKKYMNTANEVAKKAGLTEDMIKKIQEGSIDVSRYDDATQEKIKEYQKWYEKAKECGKAIEDLIDKEKELAKQRLQNIVDYYDYTAKQYRTEADTEVAKRDYNEARGKATKGTKVQKTKTESGETVYQFGEGYGDYDKEIASREDELKEIQKERKNLQNELQSLMDQGLVQEGDDTWKEYTNKIAELEKQAYETATAIEKLKDEAQKAGITTIQDRIDRREGTKSQRDRDKSLGETQGSFGQKSRKQYLKDQIKTTKAQNKELEAENQLYRQMQEGLDKANPKYKALQELIEGNEQAIDENNQAIAEWEQALDKLPIEGLENKMSGLADEADRLNDSIEEKLAKGIEVTTDSYKDLIRNGKDQIANLTKQRDAYKALMDQLVEQYGEEAKSSDLYKALEGQVNSLDAAIRDLDLSIVQWGKDMKNLAIQKLNWQLEGLKAKAEELSDTLALKEATGKVVTKADYQESILNAKNRQKILDRENKKLRKRQKGMDVNSPEYQDIQRQIEANEDEYRDLGITIAGWRKDIKNLPIKKLSAGIERLQAVASRLNDTIALKKANGEAITASDYRSLITNANMQISSYEKQNTKLRKLQSKTEYGSTEWLDIQRQIESNEDAIRDLRIATAEWGNDIKNLPINNLVAKLTKLKNAVSAAEKMIEHRRLSGIGVNEGDYSNVIYYLKQEKAINDQLISQYQKRLASAQVGSDEYNELVQKLDEANLAAIDLDNAILKYGEDQKKVNSIINGFYVDKYAAEVSKATDNIEYKKETGKRVVGYDYGPMYDAAYAQRLYLQNRINNNKLAQIGKDWTNEEYQNLQKEIDADEAAIRQIDASIAKWSKEENLLPINELEWDIDKLKDIDETINDLIDIKNLKGAIVAAQDYYNLITNAEEQRQKLLEESAKYQGLQIYLDEYSDEYQEYEEKIRSINKEISELDKNIIQWNQDIKSLPLSKLTSDLGDLEYQAEKINDDIDMRTLTGKQLDTINYANLINNAHKQIDVYQDQIAIYRELQEGMDKTSDAYQDLESKIRSSEKQINDLNKATIKWAKEIYNLKIQELTWELDEYNRSLSDMNNLMSLHTVQGIEETSDAYKKLIENGSERIRLLKEENQLLRDQQEGLDKNSAAYQELQKQIASNNDEISKIKVSQEGWNDSIIDLGINSIKKYKDALSKSNDQLKRQQDLQDALLDLEKANSQRKVRTYVEGKGFVYQQSEDDVRSAQEKLEEVVREQLLGKMDDLIEALEESKKDTNVYDQNGNLLGSVYNTPELGNLSSILSDYYKNNSNMQLDIDKLRDAFGTGFISPQENKTSFTIGDIIINEVKNGNELAKTIVDQFPNALLQALYAK